MSTPLDRISCPKCGANNMLGQDRCWQCTAALPPPEEAGHVLACSTRRRTGPPVLLVAYAVLALLLAGCLTLLLMRRSELSVADRLAEQRRILQNQSLQSTDPLPLDQDPAEQRARQELQRLQGKLGYSPPPVDQSGSVPLSTGGALSPDQYQKALHAVGKH